MGDVINFNNDTTYLELDPKEMVENAMNEYQFTSVVLMGWHGDDQFTVCTSSGSGPEIVYQLELAKKALLDAAT